MLPWCFLVGNVLQREAEASSWPIRNRGEDEGAVCGVCFCMEEGFSNLTNTFTHKLKQNLAGMHASKQMHSHTHAHTSTFTHAHFPFSRIKSRRFQRWCSWIIYGCPSAGQAVIKLRPRLICSLMRLAFSSGSWANIKYILFLQIWLPFYCYCY